MTRGPGYPVTRHRDTAHLDQKIRQFYHRLDGSVRFLETRHPRASEKPSQKCNRLTIFDSVSEIRGGASFSKSAWWTPEGDKTDESFDTNEMFSLSPSGFP